MRLPVRLRQRPPAADADQHLGVHLAGEGHGVAREVRRRPRHLPDRQPHRRHPAGHRRDAGPLRQGRHQADDVAHQPAGHGHAEGRRRGGRLRGACQGGVDPGGAHHRGRQAQVLAGPAAPALVEVLTEVDRERVGKLLEADHFFWLDLVGPSRDALDSLSALLGLHPAAVEDTREWDQLPRLDDYGDHVLLIFFSARELDGRVEPVEVHVYVSGSWIVTARRCETKLDGRRDWLAANDYEDEDEVLYLILDALADGW